LPGLGVHGECRCASLNLTIPLGCIHLTNKIWNTPRGFYWEKLNLLLTNNLLFTKVS
jgi:hypothetical protein